MVKKIIETKKAPAPIGPYNQAILIGDILYTSGQIAIEPESGELKTDNIKDETNLVMNNLKAILEASNMTFDNVVKATMDALLQLRDARTVASQRGISMSKVFNAK